KHCRHCDDIACTRCTEQHFIGVCPDTRSVHFRRDGYFRLQLARFDGSVSVSSTRPFSLQVKMMFSHVNDLLSIQKLLPIVIARFANVPFYGKGALLFISTDPVYSFAFCDPLFLSASLSTYGLMLHCPNTHHNNI